MKGLSREYLFLFNAMVCAAEDMGNLQVWVSLMHDRAKRAHRTGEVDNATEIMYGTLRNLEMRLQEFQLMFIQAQQRAEEIYLEED